MEATNRPTVQGQPEAPSLPRGVATAGGEGDPVRVELQILLSQRVGAYIEINQRSVRMQDAPVSRQLRWLRYRILEAEKRYAGIEAEARKAAKAAAAAEDRAREAR